MLLFKKEDITSLVSLLDKELSLKDKSHKVMSEQVIEEFANSMSSDIRLKKLRPETFNENRVLTGETKERSLSSKIHEFFTKIASLFGNNIVSKRVESSFGSFKQKLKDIKSAAAPNEAEHNVERVADVTGPKSSR
ncbi:MAG: hypothetical protein Q8M40_00005 [Legionella sp.]|nr:hypothetical protein [Legionella sp.]